MPIAALAVGPLAVPAIGACGSSSPPILSTNGDEAGVVIHLDAGKTAADGSNGPGDGASGSDGGAADEGGSVSTDGGGASDAATDAAPLCQPTASIGQGTLAIGTVDPDLLGAVTPDERVVAWTSIPSDGGGPAVHWAERASATDPFGPVQSLDPSLGPFAFGKVALAGDGLRLLVPSGDYSLVTEVTRAALGAPFTTVTTVDFPSVNPSGGLDGNQGLGPFISIALSPDFGSWAFVNDRGLVLSERQAGVWPPGTTPLGFAASDDGGAGDDGGGDGDASGANAPVTTIDPTGWSSDRQSLFFWDQTLAVERIAWRDRASHAFTVKRTLGAVQQYAYPAAGCSKVYYSAAGAGGDPDIFVAPFQ